MGRRTIGRGVASAVLFVVLSAGCAGPAPRLVVQPGDTTVDVAWGVPVASGDVLEAPSGQGLRPGDEVGVPSLRLRDGEGDREVEPGVTSVAVHRDGSLAFTRGRSPTYRLNVPFVSDVVVRDPQGRDVVWTEEPRDRVVLGWVDDGLLVAEAGQGLVVHRGPGQAVTFLDGGSFVATAPDGRHVAVTLPEGTGEGLGIVAVASGEVTGRVSSRVLAGLGIEDFGHNGDWRGDTVAVAADGAAPVILAVRSEGTSLVPSVISLPRSLYPSGVREVAIDDDGSLVATWSRPPVEDETSGRPLGAGAHGVVRCPGTVGGSCEDAELGSRGVALVRDTSRPLAGQTAYGEALR